MLMTIVNNPGDWGNIYPPFQHAEWHGCTLTDLVFPFFLFIVGVSIVLANPTIGKITYTNYTKVLTRAFGIFCLGFFLSFFSKIHFFGLEDIPLLVVRLVFVAVFTIIFLGDLNLRVKIYSTVIIFSTMLFLAYSGIEKFSNVRIPGVLQRIAIVYLVVTVLYFNLSTKTLFVITSIILVLYWYLMSVVKVPEFGLPNFDKGTNLAAWLDNFLLPNHMWSSSKTWDPEGVLSTLPAIGTGLLGLFVGKALVSNWEKITKTRILFTVGLVCVVVGILWGIWFPINKALWTSSYVLYTGGLAICFVALLYYVIEIHRINNWIQPFVIFGVNPMVVFFFSGIIPRGLSMIKIHNGLPNETNLQSFIYDSLILPYFNNPKTASLIAALVYLAIWYFILRYFYKKNLIFKV